MKLVRLTAATLSLSLFTLAVSAQSIPALTAYYGLKDALVASDAGKAKTQATTLSSALAKLEATKLSTADQRALTTAKTKAAAISKTTEVDEQREAFELLSTSMIALTKATKSAKQEARSGVPAPTYVQFCPMAAGGKGASWLSDKREIRNPYYGDKRLKCGTVKEEL